MCAKTQFFVNVVFSILSSRLLLRLSNYWSNNWCWNRRDLQPLHKRRFPPKHRYSRRVSLVRTDMAIRYSHIHNVGIAYTYVTVMRYALTETAKHEEPIQKRLNTLLYFLLSFSEQLTPDSPRWVGCWWLGFVIFGFIFYPLGTLVCGLPKVLKGTYRNLNISCNLQPVTRN